MNRRFGFFSLAAMAAAFLLSVAPLRAETTECTEITGIPTVISVQGVYCLKQHLNSALTSGQMIDIQTNNVTIDMNGYKLGGLAAGSGTTTSGIYAQGRSNIIIRNGFVRGFQYGVRIFGASNGILVEDVSADGNTYYGIYVEGDNVTLRGNKVIDTGNTDLSPWAYGIYLGSASGSIIEDNVVTNVTETEAAYGIVVHSSESTIVRDNSVFNPMSGVDEFGIAVTGSSNAITVVGNQLIDVSGGSFGIYATGSTNVDCVNNIGRGFLTGQQGCTTDSGNHFN